MSKLEELWRGQSEDRTQHTFASPSAKDWKRLVKEMQLTQEATLEEIKRLDENYKSDAQQRVKERARTRKAQYKGLAYRDLGSATLPALSAGSSVTFDIGMASCEHCHIAHVAVGYRTTLPSSTLGAVTLDIRARKGADDFSILAAPIDLEALTLWELDVTFTEAGGAVQPGYWLYGVLDSDNGDATGGVDGFVTLKGRIRV